MLRDSTVVVVVVVVVVVRTRPRAIPLAMIHMRKSIHRFPFFPLYGYGAPLGGLRPPELRYNVIDGRNRFVTSANWFNNSTGVYICSCEEFEIYQESFDINVKFKM